jgi:hypothetical protein
VIRPWLDSRTQSKIQILSDDGREQLLKIMSAESLPLSMGGRCQCQVTPLARQCAATSGTMIPKKVVASKSSKTTTASASSSSNGNNGNGNGVNEVTHDCANSSVEQLAYYTISLHGLAAYDPSLMPATAAAAAAATVLASSLSKVDHCSNVADDVKILSNPSKQAIESTPIAISSVIIMAPAALVTNHSSDRDSDSTITTNHVVLIPTPAPPILDEDSYDYTKDNNHNHNSSSSSSNVGTDMAVKRSSLSLASNNKVDADDVELKQRADTNDDIDHDNGSINDMPPADTNASVTQTPSRRVGQCSDPLTHYTTCMVLFDFDIVYCLWIVP